MAKHQTDSKKWNSSEFRGIPAPYKLLWFYIQDFVDLAGVWIVDFELAQFHLKVDLSEEEALKAFGNQIVDLGNGRWFLPSFIETQYGKLIDNNTLHHSVLKKLHSYEISPSPFLKVCEPPPSPSPSPYPGDKNKNKIEIQKENPKKLDVNISSVVPDHSAKEPEPPDPLRPASISNSTENFELRFSPESKTFRKILGTVWKTTLPRRVERCIPEIVRRYGQDEKSFRDWVNGKMHSPRVKDCTPTDPEHVPIIQAALEDFVWWEFGTMPLKRETNGALR